MRVRHTLSAALLALTAAAFVAPAAHALECPATFPRLPIGATIFPLAPCTDDSLWMVVYGCPPCAEPIGSVYNDSGLVIRVAAVDPELCTRVRCVPDSMVVPLGRFAPGRHALRVAYEADIRLWNAAHTDSAVCRWAWADTLRFGVLPACGPVPDSLPYVRSIAIGRGAPCATCPPVACSGDSIPVVIRGDTGTPCISFTGVELIPSMLASPLAGPPTVRLRFERNECTGIRCAEGPNPFEAGVLLPPLPEIRTSGYRLPVEALMRTYRCDPGYDSTLIGRTLRPFVVKDCSAPTGSCFLTRFRPTGSRYERCDAFVSDGRPGRTVFQVGSSVPLYGLQGDFVLDPPQLVVRAIRPIGAAAGMNVSWSPTAGGARFLLFSDGDASIPAIGDPMKDSTRLSVLEIEVGVPEVTIASDTLGPAPRVTLRAIGLFGSDVRQVRVDPCPILTRVVPLDSYVVFCREQGCDFNGDARSDVLDVVGMVRCLRHPDLCPPGPRPDCDGNGAFELADVFCCARHILRPRGPLGGDRPDPSLRLDFGAPVERDGLLSVPVALSGEQPIGGMRLAFTYPADRYEVREVRFEDGAEWLGLHEDAGGALTVGLLHLGGEAPSTNVRRFTLDLALRPGRDAGGEVSLGGADIAATDGAALIADLGAPRVSLRGGTVDLAPAQPNPFGGTTRFAVTLARAGDLTVTVHDVSGRAIATLHRGALTAGAHAFRWSGTRGDGTRAADGIYFVRARFGDATLAQKVVLLRQK